MMASYCTLESNTDLGNQERDKIKALKKVRQMHYVNLLSSGQQHIAHTA